MEKFNEVNQWKELMLFTGLFSLLLGAFLETKQIVSKRKKSRETKRNQLNEFLTNSLRPQAQSYQNEFHNWHNYYFQQKFTINDDDLVELNKKLPNLEAQMKEITVLDDTITDKLSLSELATFCKTEPNRLFQLWNGVLNAIPAYVQVFDEYNELKKEYQFPDSVRQDLVASFEQEVVTTWNDTFNLSQETHTKQQELISNLTQGL
jgi:hypothetical protein